MVSRCRRLLFCIQTLAVNQKVVQQLSHTRKRHIHRNDKYTEYIANPSKKYCFFIRIKSYDRKVIALVADLSMNVFFFNLHTLRKKCTWSTFYVTATTAIRS